MVWLAILGLGPGLDSGSDSGSESDSGSDSSLDSSSDLGSDSDLGPVHVSVRIWVWGLAWVLDLGVDWG